MNKNQFTWLFVFLVILTGVVSANYKVIYNPFQSNNMQYVQDTSSITVNNSNYWDGLDTPADINAGDITDDNTYILVADLPLENKVKSSCYNITGAVSDLCTISDTTYSAGVGLSLVGTVFSANNNGISLNAQNITSGTFGSGDFVMDSNLTVQGIVFEKDSSHTIWDNTTCVSIKGSTSVLRIC